MLTRLVKSSSSMGLRASCMPSNQPMITRLQSAAGVLQIRTETYSAA